MTNNNTQPSNLSPYAVKVDLVEIRKHPELFPQVWQTEKDEAVARMKEIVYGASLYKGQNLSDESLSFMAAALVSEIMAEPRYGLRFISWAEIGRVIRDAVLGGREMYGVNVSSIYTALVDYARGAGNEARKKADAAPLKGEATAALTAAARILAGKFRTNNP